MTLLTPTDSRYYIKPRAVSFAENDLGDVNRVYVSIASGTTIMVYVPEDNLIPYDDDKEYQKWVLTGYPTKLATSDAYYIYARLSRSDNRAIILFSTKKYKVDGSIEGEEGGGNASGNYYYIPVGNVTATDGATLRTLSFDSGKLSTPDNSYTKEQADAQFMSFEVADKRYLNALDDDEASGLIRFLKGLSLGESGNPISSVITAENAENSTLYTENALLSAAAFSKLFSIAKDDKGNYYIRTPYPLASDSTVSSLGVGEDEGGIGGTAALYQLVDVLADGDKVSGAEDGNVLMYDAATGKWYGKKVNLPDVDFSDINDKFVSIDGLIKSLQAKDVAHDESITALQTKDAAIEQSVTSLQGQLNTLVSGDASSAIESFNEVVAFLKDIEDDSTLEGILAGKQNKITETNKLDYSLLANTPSLADFMGSSAIGGTASSDNFSAVYWDGKQWQTRTLYKWALASAKPSYTTSEVTEGTRLYFTDDRAKSALKSTTDALSDRIAVFEKMFQWGDGDGSHIKTPYALASDKAVSSLGVGSDGTGGLSYDRLDSWDSYTDDKAGYVLSALLGWDLKTRLDNLDLGDFDLSGYLSKGEARDTYATIAALNSGLADKQNTISDLATIREDSKKFGNSPASAITSTNITNWNAAYDWGNHADKGYLVSSDLDGYVNEITTSGSGNAITSVTKSGKKLTFNKASTFFLAGNFTQTNIKNTLDISGWALAESKPSYNTSEVTEEGNLYFTTDRVKNYLAGAISSVLTSDLTTSRALISNASGKIAVSSVTSTELGYLDGVTSAIQTQLNALSSRIKAYEDILKIEENGTLLHATVALASDSTLSSLGVGSDGESSGGSVDWSAVPTSIIPASNGEYNLGSNSKMWYTLYVQQGFFGGITVTTNDITIQKPMLGSGSTWQIATNGAASFSSLSVGGSEINFGNYATQSQLSSYVTLRGLQTIESAKTFQNGLNFYGELKGHDSDSGGDNIVLNANDGSGSFLSLKIDSYDVLHKGNTSYSPVLTSGTKIGTIIIGGTATDLYAPVGGGDTSGLQSQIDEVGHNLDLLTEDFNTLNDTVGGLADVASSGDYNDLSNKPTIPSLTGYATETWVNSNFAKADAFTALNNSFTSLNYYLTANGSVGQVLTKKSGGYEWKSFTVDWSNVSSKPTTLSGYGITDALPYKYIGETDLNTVYDAGMYTIMGAGSNFPSSAAYGSFMVLPYRKGFGNTKPDYAAQLYFPNGDDASKNMYFRLGYSSDWGEWHTVLDNKNFSDYALPLSGGTISSSIEQALVLHRTAGGIGIKFESEGKNAWVGFEPQSSGHGVYIYTSTHYLWLTSSGVAKLDNNTLIHSGNIGSYALATGGGQMDRNTGITWNNGYYDSDAVGSHLSVLADTTQDNSLATQTGYSYNAVLNVGGGGIDTYRFQMASYATSDNFLFYRGYDANAKQWKNWVQILHTGNIGSQSVASATKATQDGEGNVISTTYATKIWVNSQGYITPEGADIEFAREITIADGTSSPLIVKGTGNNAFVKFISGTTSLGYLGFNGVNTPAWMPNDATEYIALASKSDLDGYLPLSGNASSATRARYIETKYQDRDGWYGDSYRAYIQWETSIVAKLKVDGYSTKVDYCNALSTPRTIWGQSFDGSGDVDGQLQINQSQWLNGLVLNRTEANAGAGIKFCSQGKQIGFIGINGQRYIEFDTDGTYRMLINQNGNVTIGSSDLAGTTYKLYVNGNSYVNGALTVSGDTSLSSFLTVQGKTELQAGLDVIGAVQGLEDIGGNTTWQIMPDGSASFATVITSSNMYFGAASSGASQVGVSTRIPSHIYRNVYSNDGSVYDHYYHMDYTASTNTYANLRVKSGNSYRTLLFGGDGTFSWDGHSVALEDWVTTKLGSYAALSSQNTFTAYNIFGSNVSVNGWISAYGGLDVYGKLTGYVTGTDSDTWSITGQGAATFNNLTVQSRIRISNNYNWLEVDADDWFTIKANSVIWLNASETYVSGTIGDDSGGFDNWSITSGGIANFASVSQTSDERLKNILNGDFRLSLATMANAPLVIFDWNNRSNKKHNVGTLAQYWQGALPEVVTKTQNGTLALAYGELGVAMGISLANHLTVTDDEVTKLKKRVNELEQENKRLQERVDALAA